MDFYENLTTFLIFWDYVGKNEKFLTEIFKQRVVFINNNKSNNKNNNINKPLILFLKLGGSPLCT